MSLVRQIARLLRDGWKTYSLDETPLLDQKKRAWGNVLTFRKEVGAHAD